MATVLLTGCAGFFPPLTTTTGGSGSSGTGNYVLTLDPALGTLSAYTIGSSVLTVGSGSPITLNSGLVSSTSGAIAISRNNGFVYVGGLDAIYCYSIGTSGALSFVSAGSVTTASSIVSMDTSPDGQWLFALDTLSETVSEFSMNATTGAISLIAQVSYPVAQGATLAPKTVHATATVVAASLGTAGEALFTLNTTNGTLTYSGGISLNSDTVSDNDLALSSDGSYLYVSRSGSVNGIAAYTVAAGVPSAFNSGKLTTAGTTPYAMLMDSTGAYLYVANRGSSSISEFTVSTGTLTPLSTASIATAGVVTSLARDSSAKYILSGSISSTADLSMYTFDSTTAGKLDLATSANTGVETVGLQIATTH